MVCYKKIIAAAMSLPLCGAAALPAQIAVAEESQVSEQQQEILSADGFSYVLDSSGNAIIIGMDAKDGTVDIPASLGGSPLLRSTHGLSPRPTPQWSISRQVSSTSPQKTHSAAVRALPL